jgi:hypothetical protein
LGDDLVAEPHPDPAHCGLNEWRWRPKLTTVPPIET